MRPEMVGEFPVRSLWKARGVLKPAYKDTRGLEILSDIRSNLPRVAVDVDHFKQILLNLANNSIDAVENMEGPKRITVRAFTGGTGGCRSRRFRARIQGPESRLDPFYTTKPVGKGHRAGTEHLLRNHQRARR